MVTNVLQQEECAARSSSSSERQQPILKRLNAIYRLGHGLISQEVLEELQALPRTVQGNLVPCTSDRHQCQSLVHLAPPTNLSKIHTVRFQHEEGSENVKVDVMVTLTNLFIVVPRIPVCDSL